MTETLLELKGLEVTFKTRRGTLKAVDDLSLSINKGEILGIVGESGAGKSMTGAAIIGLIDPPGRVSAGEVWFEQERVDARPESLRGRQISMVFQDPLTSLNPLRTVGDQLIETILVHMDVTKAEATHRARDGLAEVGLAPDRTHPHPPPPTAPTPPLPPSLARNRPRTSPPRATSRSPRPPVSAAPSSPRTRSPRPPSPPPPRAPSRRSPAPARARLDAPRAARERRSRRRSPRLARRTSRTVRARPEESSPRRFAPPRASRPRARRPHRASSRRPRPRPRRPRASTTTRRGTSTWRGARCGEEDASALCACGDLRTNGHTSKISLKIFPRSRVGGSL